MSGNGAMARRTVADSMPGFRGRAIRGVDYLHAHFARRGCFAARVDRA